VLFWRLIFSFAFAGVEGAFAMQSQAGGLFIASYVGHISRLTGFVTVLGVGRREKFGAYKAASMLALTRSSFVLSELRTSHGYL
jgi:hypothetical protein